MSTEVFVANLPWKVGDQELMEFFTDQGYRVDKARVIRDTDTQRSKGYGFVSVVDDVDQASIIESMKDVEMDGRKLHLDVPKAPKSKQR